MVLLDLETQLVFYRSYHHDPLNVALHLVFVPVLTYTFLMMATATGNILDIPYIPINGASLLAGIYLFLYYLMEPVAGALMTPIVAAALYNINTLVVRHGSDALWIAVYVNIAAWIAQFIGHGFFEKRAPALKDNLVQALFLAPFFVFFEGLFSLGYRPELHARIEERAVAAIAKFRASQQKEKAK